MFVVVGVGGVVVVFVGRREPVTIMRHRDRLFALRERLVEYGFESTVELLASSPLAFRLASSVAWHRPYRLDLPLTNMFSCVGASSFFSVSQAATPLQLEVDNVWDLVEPTVYRLPIPCCVLSARRARRGGVGLGLLELPCKISTALPD